MPSIDSEVRDILYKRAIFNILFNRCILNEFLIYFIKKNPKRRHSELFMENNTILPCSGIISLSIRS